ncbi:MAG TPA: FAD-dependent thymidylate synthase [Terriglobales bacterium]|jgi:thymidylate synthase ThyX|nr:FAD-dependent thymidylate synthase [Terriglobales bacterium]
MSHPNGTKPASPPELGTPQSSTPSTEVFAVHGVEPEVQAYAMAKYSRSALSMKESLKEISEQKAEQFLNTFYFQYGHRSIADLAHIPMAIERLSILAAIALVDEQRWDGQERSTRYQNFKKSGFYVPEFENSEDRDLYIETVKFLFSEYEAISDEMARYLATQVAKPDDMTQEAYQRTLRARAFDISRYLLPLATNTSLGQIVNARTLETQISRLLTHTHAEVRQLGDALKQAARSASYNVNEATYRKLVDEIAAQNPALADRAREVLLKDVRVAPTLVKYAEANRYEQETRRELRQAVRELIPIDTVIDDGPLGQPFVVDLLEDEPLEIELATTLLYGADHYSYRQLREAVTSLSAARRQEIIDLGMRHRGKHDELLRPFAAGQAFRFDILMDIGGFRDMHRHRRCVQIEQEFTNLHGFATPEELTASGLQNRYGETMLLASDRHDEFSGADDPNAEQNAQYVLPLAFKKRTLFKMDFAEALYISELRTTPAGHRSYREVAYAMYEAVAHRHPSLAKYFRVHDVREPVDLLKR